MVVVVLLVYWALGRQLFPGKRDCLFETSPLYIPLACFVLRNTIHTRPARLLCTFPRGRHDLSDTTK